MSKFIIYLELFDANQIEYTMIDNIMQNTCFIKTIKDKNIKLPPALYYYTGAITDKQTILDLFKHTIQKSIIYNSIAVIKYDDLLLFMH